MNAGQSSATVRCRDLRDDPDFPGSNVARCRTEYRCCAGHHLWARAASKPSSGTSRVPSNATCCPSRVHNSNATPQRNRRALARGSAIGRARAGSRPLRSGRMAEHSAHGNELPAHHERPSSLLRRRAHSSKCSVHKHHTEHGLIEPIGDRNGIS